MRTTAHGTEDDQPEGLVLRRARKVDDEAARQATQIAAANKERKAEQHEDATRGGSEASERQHGAAGESSDAV